MKKRNVAIEPCDNGWIIQWEQEKTPATTGMGVPVASLLDHETHREVFTNRKKLIHKLKALL